MQIYSNISILQKIGPQNFTGIDFYTTFAGIMTDAPLISIITVTYNAASTLPPTLISLREQTYQDFEHIIVDGASGDDTLAIARRQGRPGLRIVSEPDRGLYDAMNKGLHLARGKYVLFLNAGDAFAGPDELMAYARAASLEPAPDIIYADTDIVDSSRNIVARRHLSVPEQLTFKSFSHGMLVCHQAFMMRRSLAPDFDLHYRFSADYDWTVRCLALTDADACVNLHRTAIHYLNDGLTGKNHFASLRERYRIMARHYGRITALGRHLGFIPRAIARKFK